MISLCFIFRSFSFEHISSHEQNRPKTRILSVHWNSNRDKKNSSEDETGAETWIRNGGERFVSALVLARAFERLRTWPGWPLLPPSSHLFYPSLCLSSLICIWHHSSDSSYVYRDAPPKETLCMIMLESWKERSKKTQQPAGFQPTTSFKAGWCSIRCATTTALPGTPWLQPQDYFIMAEQCCTIPLKHPCGP